LILGGAAVVATVIAAVATISLPATSVVAVFLARLLLRLLQWSKLLLSKWVRLPTRSGQWCRRLGRGIECHGGSSSGLCTLGALLNFLETKVIAHLLEGREGCRVGEDGAKMLVLFVEVTEYIEDEHTIGDVGAKIVEGVGKALHFPAIVVHVEVTLNEVVEDGVDVEGTSLIVADELVL
jgi:hypothetical protein